MCKWGQCSRLDWIAYLSLAAAHSRSTRLVLPWSTCAITARLRCFFPLSVVGPSRESPGASGAAAPENLRNAADGLENTIADTRSDTTVAADTRGRDGSWPSLQTEPKYRRADPGNLSILEQASSKEERHAQKGEAYRVFMQQEFSVYVQTRFAGRTGLAAERRYCCCTSALGERLIDAS